LVETPDWGIRACQSIAIRVNGTEMHQRSFKIYTPATMPASAMSKMDYFRVARHPPAIGSKLQVELPTSQQRDF